MFNLKSKMMKEDEGMQQAHPEIINQLKVIEGIVDRIDSRIAKIASPVSKLGKVYYPDAESKEQDPDRPEIYAWIRAIADKLSEQEGSLAAIDDALHKSIG